MQDSRILSPFTSVKGRQTYFQMGYHICLEITNVILPYSFIGMIHSPPYES